MLFQVCAECQTEKSADSFHWQNKALSKRMTVCKDCRSLANKRRYQIKKTRILNINREWRIINHERMLQLSRDWRKANPDQCIVQVQKRRARKAGTLSDGSSRKEVWIASEGKCHICSQVWNLEDRSWHIDHIVPLSKGGTDLLSNKAVSCAFCNMSKGSKLRNEVLCLS